MSDCRNYNISRTTPEASSALELNTSTTPCLACHFSAAFNHRPISTGKEQDTESGNDYFPARYYASSMGRWMSPDPSGLYLADPENPQTLNLYSYVLNNPLKFYDPDGLQVAPAMECHPAWLCVVTHFIKRIFSGGGGGGGNGGGGGGDDGGGGGGGGGGWSPIPPTSGHYVTVGFYPAGAAWIGGHYGVGLDTPTGTQGWATVKKHPFVAYLTGLPFAGQLKKDTDTYKDRMKGLAKPRYLYMPISEEAEDAMESAIKGRSSDGGSYDLYFRNCAQFVEDVLHAGGIGGVPHNEVFLPRGLRLWLLLQSHTPH